MAGAGAPSWRSFATDVADVDLPDGMTAEPVMEEYCIRCHSEVAGVTVAHESYETDLQVYRCDDCGYSDLFQIDEPGAEGAVYERAEITDKEDFFREITVSSGATVAVKDCSADYAALSPEPGVQEPPLFERQYDQDRVTRPDGLLHDLLSTHEVVLPDALRTRLESHLEDPDFVVELYDETGGSGIADPQVRMVKPVGLEPAE